MFFPGKTYLQVCANRFCPRKTYSQLRQIGFPEVYKFRRNLFAQRFPANRFLGFLGFAGRWRDENGPGVREPRRSDSPTGAGGPPDFPRGGKLTTRPPPFVALGNSGVPPAPVGGYLRRHSRSRFAVGVSVRPGLAPGTTSERFSHWGR